MKKILLLLLLQMTVLFMVKGQEKIWTLNECMLYAVENSPKVKQKSYEADSYEASYTTALGAFLPSISANVEGAYNFGRSLKDDNTYADISSFANYYTLNASLPVFTGGQLINQWRQAKVNRQLGKSDVQVTRDDIAMRTMDVFMNVIYYQGMIKIASEKLEESSRMFLQTQRMEELGLKSKADLAQIEAQLAGDDYLLTQQENQYNTALLTLKDLMNYPYDENLVIDTMITYTDYFPPLESVEDISTYALAHNPQALSAEYNYKSYQLQHKVMKGKLYPSVYLYGRVSTNYLYYLGEDFDQLVFHEQWKNKMSEYVGISVSIPIFQGLSNISGIRRARNNMRIAAEQQVDINRQIQTTIEQNVLDRQGYAKEIIQMEKQVDANDMAYKLTLRRYEEGLMSSLDLQTSSYNLLQSRSNLLQRRLMYIIKDRIVNYYKGIPLVEE
ncbi:MAG: TolC family protein [Tannerellaceae bacterium]|nr:TolC family protein [Tannerellaceae bacterium]